jgi:hypothetical protein
MPLVFATHNTTTGTPLARAGICNGMTAAWARFSLRHSGCTAANKSQVEADGLLLATRVRLALTGKLDADRGAQWETMLSTIGLQNTHRTSRRFGGGIALATELIKYGDATAYIVITFDGGVHAMGARVTSATFDFFDPNVGLLRVDTRVGFTSAMVDGMRMYTGWTTRDTHVWTLNA